MRLSIETLNLLAGLGDNLALMTAEFWGTHQDTQIWSVNGGNIGAGWLGVPFGPASTCSGCNGHFTYTLTRVGRWSVCEDCHDKLMT